MTSSFDKAAKMLQSVSGGINRAIYAAMGRTLSMAKTAVTREIRQEYEVKASTVRKTVTSQRVKESNSTKGVIRVKSANLLANQFKFKPRSETTGAKRRSVQVAIRKGGARRVDSGFVHNGVVLQRVGSTSYPIKPVFGPSTAGMAANDAVIKNVQESVPEIFERRLAHEVQRILGAKNGTRAR